ncbi:uncharacterized protein TNIN_89111 [Trichonephila inaurata madagascariensis]|uniref:Uncharacterized protein n=1 Tax=Trichonephila inaurata madagascariensis TaxID=2747483 RepID=A0A8X6YJW8_9ARAC|nr:uncharacterized protein TNIN_89111 [Trichonephila inaurata madagascariensis]
MLRALTSYFFGNVQDETPEVPVECETHEVNDWLVVNLPDQTENSINLDDETEVNNEEDLNEDDILLSVSILMQSEGLSDESLYVCEDVYDGIINIPYEISDTKNIIEASHGQLVATSFTIRNPQIETIHEFMETVPDIKEFRPKLFSEFCLKQCQIFDSSSDYIFEFVNRIRAVMPPVVIEDCSVTCACTPTCSKAYVNHRPPTPTQNTDLIQRIKELEPEQKAIRRIAKKNLSRSQINRQNKNYIYENSSKKNRRNNLQRNYSYNRTSY